MHAAAPETVSSFTPLVTGDATKSIISIQSQSKLLEVSSSPSCVPLPLLLLSYINELEVPRATAAQCSQCPCLASLTLHRRCPSWAPQHHAQGAPSPQPASERWRRRFEAAGAVHRCQEPCRAELRPFGRFPSLFRHTGTSPPRGGPNCTSHRSLLLITHRTASASTPRPSPWSAAAGEPSIKLHVCFINQIFSAWSPFSSLSQCL
jgi:hypothetical protein